MPMISECEKLLMLSSFWFAILRGGMQLCEMAKRSGVACSQTWSCHKRKRHHRSVTGPREGR